jgi:hypothetical protein
VPVRRVYAFFRDGAKVETILKRYPQLGAAKVLDALAFALDNPEVIQSDIEVEHAALARAGHKPTRSRVSEKQIALPFGSEEDE